MSKSSSRKKKVKPFPKETEDVWNVNLGTVAYQLGIPDQTIRNQINSEDGFPIKHKKIGRLYYFKTADVRKFQEELYG